MTPFLSQRRRQLPTKSVESATTGKSFLIQPETVRHAPDGHGRNGDLVKEFLWIIAGIWAVFMGWLFIPAFIRGGPEPEKISPTYARRSIVLFVLIIAVFILWSRTDPDLVLTRFVPDTAAAGIAGIALTIIGLGFSAYARRYLGKNWSSMVMIKEGHQLIRTGPYRWVRNPMYTGMLTAYLGLVIAFGIVAALAALVILFAALWIKITAEQELLEEKFGEEYRQYRRDVKAIIPFLL